MHSISFKEDQEGFLYPKVDTETCIDCGLCEKVCPVINQNNERFPSRVFAAKHPDDEIRMSSSSGGIFTLLAEQIIDNGGVVFGARFNENWEVVHDFTETKEGLIPFRGSKYVQSRIGDAYVNVEKFLQSGRSVMFTGTPCQVAGLKKYLRKEYENLLAVDFVCHGVPSPMVWREYIKKEMSRNQNAVLTGVDFRDKSTGWKKYSVAIKFSKCSEMIGQTTIVSTQFTENVYMRAFLSNLILRPSCYNCSSKTGKSNSDLTIGDFWGVDNILKDYDDDKGTSVLFDYSGDVDDNILHKLNAIDVSYEDSIIQNSSYNRSSECHPNRTRYFASVDSGDIITSMIKYCNLPWTLRVRRKIRTIIFKLSRR